MIIITIPRNKSMELILLDRGEGIVTECDIDQFRKGLVDLVVILSSINQGY